MRGQYANLQIKTSFKTPLGWAPLDYRLFPKLKYAKLFSNKGVAEIFLKGLSYKSNKIFVHLFIIFAIMLSNKAFLLLNIKPFCIVLTNYQYPLVCIVY